MPIRDFVFRPEDRLVISMVELVGKLATVGCRPTVDGKLVGRCSDVSAIWVGEIAVFAGTGNKRKERSIHNMHVCICEPYC